MFRGLGAELADEQWTRWRRATSEVVAGLPSDTEALFVVDHPRRPGALVSCGAGIVVARLPSPWHPEGRTGYLQWMSTEPAFRRQGLARGVLRALLGWFDARGIDNIELHATAEGAPLYRSEGFWRGSGGEPMRRRPWDPPPPGDD